MLSPIQAFIGTCRSSRGLALLAVPALVVLASCGETDDGLGKRYPVSGTVTYNGNPLEKGEISFVTGDVSKNFGATGTITNGSYTLSMGGEGDGAQPGQYKVTISAKEDYREKAEQEYKKVTGGGVPSCCRISLQKQRRVPRTSSQLGTVTPAPRRSPRKSNKNPTRSISRSLTPKLRPSRPSRRRQTFDIVDRLIVRVLAELQRSRPDPDSHRGLLHDALRLRIHTSKRLGVLPAKVIEIRLVPAAITGPLLGL